MKKTIAAFSLLALLATLSGCVVYSEQRYGSAGAEFSSVDLGMDVSRVIQVLGAPDFVYDHGDLEVLVYKIRKGQTILGPVYTQASREDLVVVIGPDGRVLSQNRIHMGEGRTILGPTDTVPLSISGGGAITPGSPGPEGSLMGGPDNYTREAE